MLNKNAMVIFQKLTVFRLLSLIIFYSLSFTIHATTYGNDDCELMQRYARQQGRTIDSFETCRNVCMKVGSAYSQATCPIICEKCGFKKAAGAEIPSVSSGYTNLRQIEADGKNVPGTKLTMWCRLDSNSSAKKFANFQCRDSQYSKERDDVIKVKKTNKVEEIIEKLEDSGSRVKIDFEISEVKQMGGVTFKILKVYSKQ